MYDIIIPLEEEGAGEETMTHHGYQSRLYDNAIAIDASQSSSTFCRCIFGIFIHVQSRSHKNGTRQVAGHNVNVIRISYLDSKEIVVLYLYDLLYLFFVT